MKWYRSYLTDLETTIAFADRKRRSFVYDPGHCEPYYASSNFGYWGLFEKATESFCLLEWDIALSFEDRKRFENYCKADPEHIHVAPYQHYGYKNVYTDFSHIHRQGPMNFAREGDPYCFYFGFGLIYLPLHLVKQYMRDAENGFVVNTEAGSTCPLYPGEPKFDESFDCIFSDWYTTAWDMEPVPIHWDVRPIHLNYDVKSPFDDAHDQIEKQEEARQFARDGEQGAGLFSLSKSVA
jgi:hypothetical protein